MSTHANTIRRHLDLLFEEDREAAAYAALDRLLAENRRLREALEQIASIPNRSTAEIAREALAGDAE